MDEGSAKFDLPTVALKKSPRLTMADESRETPSQFRLVSAQLSVSRRAWPPPSNVLDRAFEHTLLTAGRSRRASRARGLADPSADKVRVFSRLYCADHMN